MTQATQDVTGRQEGSTCHSITLGTCHEEALSSPGIGSETSPPRKPGMLESLLNTHNPPTHSEVSVETYNP